MRALLQILLLLLVSTGQALPAQLPDFYDRELANCPEKLLDRGVCGVRDFWKLQSFNSEKYFVDLRYAGEPARFAAIQGREVNMQAGGTIPAGGIADPVYRQIGKSVHGVSRSTTSTRVGAIPCPKRPGCRMLWQQRMVRVDVRRLCSKDGGDKCAHDLQHVNYPIVDDKGAPLGRFWACYEDAKDGEEACGEAKEAEYSPGFRVDYSGF